MLQQLKGLRRSIWYVMKRVLFVNKSCTKGESFLLKMDYKRVRVRPMGRASPYKTLLSFSRVMYSGPT